MHKLNKTGREEQSVLLEWQKKKLSFTTTQALSRLPDIKFIKDQWRKKQ